MKKMIFLFALILAFNCKSETENQEKTTLDTSHTNESQAERTDGYNAFKNPYFGQTHLHTGWSFDEAFYNVRVGPENAYKHARGDKVKHPYGYDVQLKIPLDFMVVSEHAEYMGVLIQMYDPCLLYTSDAADD